MNTWSLLRWGVVAGPFYLTLGVGQALLRDGFDLSRHSLSVLANGPGGWVQTANFVLTGVMVLAAAAGFARVLGRSRPVVWFLAGFGVSIIAAAVFRADPVDGFPPGTPAGFPTTISISGLLHFAAGALGFLCLALSGFAAARTLRGKGGLLLAPISLFSGITVVLGFLSGLLAPPGLFGIWMAVVVGWLWLAVTSLGLKRLA
jgi:hypothetical protein